MYRVVCIYPEPSGGVYASAMDFSDAEDAASAVVDELERGATSCTVTYLMEEVQDTPVTIP